jgi:tRNA (cmo5U34)-methyltransferase
MTETSFDWHRPAAAREWIQNRPVGSPMRSQQIEVLIDLLSALQSDGHCILDLGCGDGIIAELLLTRFPSAYVVGVDSSSPMLEAARARLSRYVGRFTLLTHDLRATDDPLVEVGSFDAAISVHAVHHLTGPEKQRLFHWISISLRDGGLIAMADRVKLGEPLLFKYHLAVWNRVQLQYGLEPSSPGYAYADHVARCEQGGDLPDLLSDQLIWLQAAGFGVVDVFYRFVERAVFGGLKVPRLEAQSPIRTDAALVNLRGL